MKFKCPKCKKILNRDGRTKLVKGKKYIISYCEKVGKEAKCYRVIGARL